MLAVPSAETKTPNALFWALASSGWSLNETFCGAVRSLSSELIAVEDRVFM